MAVELLRCRMKRARRNGKQGPPTLSIKREAHHDLEGLIWVLVYAMMVHRYNSLIHETDRAEYKRELDSCFGHGSTHTIHQQRCVMLYSAQTWGDEYTIYEWFPDPRERRFFIRCMKLVADHDRGEKEEETFGPFEGEISYENRLWDSSDDENDNSPTCKATTKGQTSAASLRTRPPVITYESMAAILKKSIDEFH